MAVITFDPRKVFHYGFVVPNMDRALKTWTQQGATLVVPPAIDPAQNVSCALLIYLDSVPIELVAPLCDGPNPVASRLAKGGGLDHVCLFSDSLEDDVAKLEADGAMVVVAPCYGAVFKRRLAFVVTRAGLVVELMTRTTVEGAEGDPLAPLNGRA
ncbi:VOC family protein [Sinorhizobium meliloti]|uniref:VOC family protein n=2 Tax=Rhizobium meliloti TaxID=382 RepID=UPI000FDCDA66|nr:VOC family protein [Sinorhizobium meliloti]QGJ78474.1 hypothetical protein C3L21_32365 [Sinorhizobium meliloti]RVH04115.1 VOC family protein [Sinorhizobium meliloti]RVK47585.1 VOC family protein [Sinorhizobium meliloti]RVM70444.1 VOC family protein [Sinorhizobium meliloti]RVM82983.1 VOC family protein [Sinorhizobium meliloti]